MPGRKDTNSTYHSGDTRERLLRAALEAFGVHGYEGVSTRQLANLAAKSIPCPVFLKIP